MQRAANFRGQSDQSSQWCASITCMRQSLGSRSCAEAVGRPRVATLTWPRMRRRQTTTPPFAASWTPWLARFSCSCAMYPHCCRHQSRAGNPNPAGFIEMTVAPSLLRNGRLFSIDASSVLKARPPPCAYNAVKQFVRRPAARTSPMFASRACAASAVWSAIACMRLVCD